jgi:hypothetical protein
VWAPVGYNDGLTGSGLEIAGGPFVLDTKLNGGTLDKTDGLKLSDSLATDIGNNTTHRGSAGTDHSDVASNNAHRGGSGSDHSDVAANTTHRGSAGGTDHSDVGLNNTHRGSAGTDHSDVGLNNTHRGSNGLDHLYLKQNLVDVTIAVADTATDDAAMTIDVEDLGGAALSKVCSFLVYASTTQWGGPTSPNANCTLGAPSKGGIRASDAANGWWLVETDSNGQFAATVTNTTNEQVWFVVASSDRGVSSLGYGVHVHGCIPDDATWS